MTGATAKEKLLALFDAALARGTFVKLTLGGPRGADPTLRSLSVRRVEVRAGPRLSFVYRHDRRDVTRNFDFQEGTARIAQHLEAGFRNAHLFTTDQDAELSLRANQPPRFVVRPPTHLAPAPTAHDRAKPRLIPARDAAWLHALGVTTATGTVREGMAAKFRQINKFVEILQHLLAQLSAVPPAPEHARPQPHSSEVPSPSPQSLSVDQPEVATCRDAPTPGGPRFWSSGLSLVDMGCGKGYLTFAAFDFLRRAGVRSLEARGVDARPELVELGNRVARDCGFEGLRFECGTIESAPLTRTDVLVALHACDTATDDALARGIRAGAALILVAPCCHKELRPQLRPPPVLAGALRHGIFRERQAEFVTDALRAALLEWAGYETKVFEFISPEHTAKNLMIAGIHRRSPDLEATRSRVEQLAAFYGIHQQRLALHLGFALPGRPVAARGA